MSNQLKEKPPVGMGKGRMLLQALMNPLKFKPYFGKCLRSFTNEMQINFEKKLSPVSPDTFSNPKVPITFRDCSYQYENLPLHELFYLVGIVASRKPKRLLEIGTFNGNTTLQMALNSPSEALIATLDLDRNQEGYSSYGEGPRRYENSMVAHKIEQHLGNSMEMDFSQFTKKGSIDFIFIDAGHDYEFVKNDTLKALEILSEDGIIVWHDYTEEHPGVFMWLNELSEKLPLVHIEGTWLAVYDRSKNFYNSAENGASSKMGPIST